MTPNVYLYGVNLQGRARLIAVVDGREIDACSASGDNLVEKAARLIGGSARYVGLHAYKNEKTFVDLFHERSLSGWFTAGPDFAAYVALHQVSEIKDTQFYLIGTNGLLLHVEDPVDTEAA